MKDIQDRFDLNITRRADIAMITIALRYLEWLIDMGLVETEEMFELSYLAIVHTVHGFDERKMELFVDSIESKRSEHDKEKLSG